MSLADSIAIVTGGSRGIGAAISAELGRLGAAVVVNYARNAEAAEHVCAGITAAGGRAIAVGADVSVADDAGRLVQACVDTFGPPDILVNNAGVTRDRLLLRMTEEDWDVVLDTNLKGPFLAIRAAAPLMVKARRGVVVNVGSVVGRVGAAGQVNYSASKAGLVGLTKSLARELGSRNIRVNTVAPGFIETEMTGVLKEEQKEAALRQIPLGRFGSADDIARVVAFLCSPASAYIHGEVITVDGGLFM